MACRSNQFEDVAWKDLKPGNIIKISEDEAIPADICLLQSSDHKGTLYIETKNLDGETNLKNKFVHKDINDLYSNDLQAMQRLQGTIYCEAPNNAIYKFEGQFLLDG
jgi:P-type E1-E2 ATPase